MKFYRGFTLIELLIVVAIIAILAAIVVPNFLEAQTRAKVSRVMADLRSFSTAIEAYAADQGGYPSYGRISPDGAVQYPAVVNNINDRTCFATRGITTPIAYISSLFRDPFLETAATDVSYIKEYEYLNMNQHVANFAHMGINPPFKDKLIPRYGAWRILGAGTDGDRGNDVKLNIVYDSSNGTVSNGNIVRCQLRADSSIHTIPD